MNNNQPYRHAKWSLLAPLLTGSLTSAAQSVLEEVVVVAQKRTQNIQDVPIAISAFTENFLIETGISNTLELAMVTPGLSYGKQWMGGVPFIRGIGTQIARLVMVVWQRVKAW
jgi:iron complex outermembrane recepter protein